MTFKERPILFSAPMVRAILEGRKTQTRRVVKPQPAGEWAAPGKTSCPYGVPGDRLWVRETWGVWHDMYVEDTVNEPTFWRADYTDADERAGVMPRWRTSIHMPRARSRLTLEVTGVRVERLQEISEADALAEGVEPLDSRAHEDRDEFDHALCGNCGGRRLYDSIGSNMGVRPDTDCGECDTHVKRYRWLWESINGADSWAANPYVRVIEFSQLNDKADKT